MKGLAEKKTKRNNTPTHCNITYYLYSLWKTGLKHRILICQNNQQAQTHFFFIIQDKQIHKKTNMAVLTVHTRIFLTGEALNMLLLFPSVTYSLSTGSLVQTLAPHPSHQQYLTTTQSIAISYHNKCHCYPHHISPKYSIIISLVMLMNPSLFTEC